jgi:tRNA A37 methylthiotransferase MiaB
VDAAREAVPDIGLAGDTIVGFCGETEADFMKTVELHERTRYQNAYMFMYSERDYTPAKDLGLVDDVPFGGFRQLPQKTTPEAPHSVHAGQCLKVHQ